MVYNFASAYEKAMPQTAGALLKGFVPPAEA